MKIGKYLIIKAAELPYIRKAHKLARAMSEDQLDDLLEGRRHIHRNPTKKIRAVPGPYPVPEERVIVF
jgi:hypothetical protein